jgi:hypothetical protein
MSSRRRDGCCSSSSRLGELTRTRRAIGQTGIVATIKDHGPVIVDDPVVRDRRDEATVSVVVILAISRALLVSHRSAESGSGRRWAPASVDTGAGRVLIHPTGAALRDSPRSMFAATSRSWDETWCEIELKRVGWRGHNPCKPGLLTPREARCSAIIGPLLIRRAGGRMELAGSVRCSAPVVVALVARGG